MRLTAASRISFSLAILLLQPLVVLWYLQFFFESPPQSDLPFSVLRWRLLQNGFSIDAVAPYVCGVVWLLGTAAVAVGAMRGGSWRWSLDRIGRANAWSLLLAVHILLTYFASSRTPGLLPAVVFLTPTLIIVALAGWLSGHWQAASSPRDAGWRWTWIYVAAAAMVYVCVFAGLSILQYQSLHVPHGDTGMYEEHLWNWLCGKGFRSQLDDGRLFLGEHIQLIHLLLAPIYWLAPSLPTMMICQSVALASGSFAVAWLCRTKGFPAATAAALALGYLLYFPLQYLNIEVTWKCFRPTTFGVPLLLFAVAALESERYRLMLALLALALLVKEEYAIAVGTLGLYLAVRSFGRPAGRKELWLGLAVAVFAVVYLAAVLWVLIPYFRGGAPHYTPYFTQLHADPLQAFARLGSMQNLRFFVLMLLPLGGLPLFSPRRFAVAAPFFVYLMLGDPDRRLAEPFLHFHAPLVPLLFWATVGGLDRVGRRVDRNHLSRWIASLALASGFWYGKSPLSWKFYDSFEGTPRRQQGAFLTWEPIGSYWRDVYLPDARATESFPKVLKTVSPQDRVAATDYIRTRFTHFRAAHDYPTLRGHVDIDDIDVIVLDQTEGWWGRGPTNPDRELLACMNDAGCGVGTTLTVRGRPFTVIYHDEYFLAVRRLSDRETKDAASD